MRTVHVVIFDNATSKATNSGFRTLPHTLKGIQFFPLFWAVCIIPLLPRRRRAAIFTPDYFILRPAFGAPLRIPIGGIKRVTLLDTGLK